MGFHQQLWGKFNRKWGKSTENKLLIRIKIIIDNLKVLP